MAEGNSSWRQEIAQATRAKGEEHVEKTVSVPYVVHSPHPLGCGAHAHNPSIGP